MTAHDRTLLEYATARMSRDDVKLARMLAAIELVGEPDDPTAGVTPAAYRFLAYNLRDPRNRAALQAALALPVVR